METVAILPQLFMLSKTGEAESITSHYLMALGSYRALESSVSPTVPLSQHENQGQR